MGAAKGKRGLRNTSGGRSLTKRRSFVQGHGLSLGLHFWGEPWQFSVVSSAGEVADWGWGVRSLLCTQPLGDQEANHLPE